MAKLIFLSIILGVFFSSHGLQLPLVELEPVGTSPFADICKGANENDGKRYCDGTNICAATGYYVCNALALHFSCNNASIPYCTDDKKGVAPNQWAGNARCVATKPNDDEDKPCPAPPPDFVCLQSGILPHPSDCKKYYYCPSLNSDSTRDNPTEYNCPDGYAFDPSLSDLFPCRLTRNAAAYCISSTLNCQTASGSQQRLNYPYFPARLGQFGVYCASKPLVYKCGPNSQFQNIDFDVAGNIIPVCSIANVQCSSDGQRFLDASNPDGYFVCVLNIPTNRYNAISVNCPPKFTYNARLNDCVAKPGDLSAYVTTADMITAIAAAINETLPVATTMETTTTV